MPRELVAIIEPHGKYTLDWREAEAVASESCEDLYSRFQKEPSQALLNLGFHPVDRSFSTSLCFLQNISSSYIHELSRTPELEVFRERAPLPENKEVIQNLIAAAPFMPGQEHLSEEWIKTSWGKLHIVFSEEIKAFKGTVAEYFKSKGMDANIPGRVYFHLVENRDEEAPFAFLATYTVPSINDNKSRHIPLNHALAEYAEDSKKMLELLVTVYKAAEKSEFVASILESREIFYPLKISTSEAYTILKEIPLYEESGILCRVPNWWRHKSNNVKINVTIGEKNISRLNANALLSFNMQLSLGGVSLTIAEAKKLLSESDGLAFIKNKWIEIDHGKLHELLSIYENFQKASKDKSLSIVDAMRLQFAGDSLMPEADDSDVFEISNGAWLQKMLTGLLRPDSLPEITCGKNFKATLRPYQKHGLRWLHYMRTISMGALLADDMGLGKTLQVLALLDYIHNGSVGQKTLLVVPASLIGNWVSEIERFAPGLSYAVIHPSQQQNAGSNCKEMTKNKALSITTYGLVSKYDWLQNIHWDCLVIDEAQAIKNPGTKQSKAIKRIKSKFRIAMTGTPIENRLIDLWSIFDFLNTGLLGTTKEFTRFTRGLKDRPEGHKKLKKIVSPFILRRLKTDKSIISDLPEKIEMKTFAALTKKQAVLYADLVAQLKHSLEEVDQGIRRKGIILGSLIKFKQICNHPDQYLGQRQYLESESGKFARLREICETIAEKRERVLVFTQFKEITAHLAEFLENVFGRKGLVLHGETAVKKRKEIVDIFQGEEYVPFMVLSIKAGGVGLNLTAANHIIHFDRWWNPAVEDQATDRAFRIGQKKNVVVHKFITEGTLEEKINLLIEDKQKLVRDIIPDAQEKLISEMSNEELFNLLNLSA